MYNIVLHWFVRWSRCLQFRDTVSPASKKRDDARRSSKITSPRHLWLFWTILFAGTLLVASSVVPTRPAPPIATGNGGQTAASRFCGPPLRVVQHFRITNELGYPYTVSTLPSSIHLVMLPKPTTGGQVFYEPQTNTLCAINAVVLRAAWQQIITPIPVLATVVPTILPSPSTTAPPAFQVGSTNFLAQGAIDTMTGIWTGFFHWVGQTVQYVEDWATATLGFMWETPVALSYKNSVVTTGLSWMLGLMNGLIMLLLVLGGYQCLIRTALGEPRQEVLAFLLHLLIAAVVANVVVLYLIPQLIDLNNTLCLGALRVFVHAGTGDFKVPFFGGANWLQQPLTWSLFLLIAFVIGLLLMLSMLVRLALFLVCYITAPIGILLLASGSPALRGWGQLWCRLFFYSLFIQFLQVLIVAIGSAFATSFLTLGSEGSLSPTSLFVGIAALYLAFKLPQMLLMPVIGAVYGDTTRGISLAGTIAAIQAS